MKIFGNYWKILSGCETSNLYWQVLISKLFSDIFRQVLKSLIIIRKFLEIIGKYCWGVRRRIPSDRFLMSEFLFKNYRKILLECETTILFKQILIRWIIFGNYWKILSGCETTNLFRPVLKEWEIFFGNFRKLLENIIGVQDVESQTGSYKVNFFSEIIGKYCWSARQKFFRQFLIRWIIIENFWK